MFLHTLCQINIIFAVIPYGSIFSGIKEVGLYNLVIDAIVNVERRKLQGSEQGNMKSNTVHTSNSQQVSQSPLSRRNSSYTEESDTEGYDTDTEKSPLIKKHSKRKYKVKNTQ